MGEALILKGTELGKTWTMDTMHEDITALKGQLEGLKHGYERWIHVIIQATLPGQCQMTKRDL